MLNVIASVVMTVISLTISTVVYIRTPLVVGAIVLAIIMSFPATSYAAVIQCNATHCNMITQFTNTMSFSEIFGTFTVIAGIIVTMFLAKSK
jgi:hypothetical protein